MRYVQAGILAALVLICGLLFSISMKMNQPAPAAVQTAAPVAATPAVAPPVTPAVITTPTPAPSPVRTRSVSRASDPGKPRPAAASNSTTVAQSSPAAIPPPPPPPVISSGDSVPRPRTSDSDNSGPMYPNSVMAPQGGYPPPPPPSATRTLTVPAGTPFTVRMLDSIDTERNRMGDTFQASLDEDLQADGVVVARRGSVVHGKIVDAKQSGRVAGVATMAIEIQSISTVAGDQQVVTEAVKKEAQSTKGRDAAKVGILSGIGAAIGAVAGGRAGAGIGAGAGATAGVADVMIERGKPVKLNPEDRVTFRLRAPLTVNADGSKIQGPSDPDRPTLHRRNGE